MLLGRNKSSNHIFQGTLTILTSGGQTPYAKLSKAVVREVVFLYWQLQYSISEHSSSVNVESSKYIVSRFLFSSGLSLPQPAKTLLGGMHLCPPKGECQASRCEEAQVPCHLTLKALTIISSHWKDCNTLIDGSGPLKTSCADTLQSLAQTMQTRNFVTWGTIAHLPMALSKSISILQNTARR